MGQGTALRGGTDRLRKNSACRSGDFDLHSKVATGTTSSMRARKRRDRRRERADAGRHGHQFRFREPRALVLPTTGCRFDLRDSSPSGSESGVVTAAGVLGWSCSTSTLTGEATTTEDSLPLSELLQKAGEGDLYACCSRRRALELGPAFYDNRPVHGPIEFGLRSRRGR